MNEHSLGTHIEVAPNSKFQCGGSFRKFYMFYRPEKVIGTFKILWGNLKEVARWGGFSTDPWCSLVTSVAFGLAKLIDPKRLYLIVTEMLAQMKWVRNGSPGGLDSARNKIISLWTCNIPASSQD